MNTQRLISARKASGLSQQQLGELLDGSDSESVRKKILRYESGASSPSYNTARKMAQILGVPTCYFYIDDDLFAEKVLNLHRNDKLENSLSTVLKRNEEKIQQYEKVLSEIKKSMSQLK